MLTPEDIEARNFLVSLRGFDRAEVREFLVEVAEHVRDLQERAAAAGAAPAAGDTEPVPAADEPAAAGRDQASAMFADIGRETAKILEAAQEAAQGLIRQAGIDADRQVQEARREAADIVAEGERRRAEIEEVVAALEAARESLAGNFQEVATTVERVLTELGTETPLPPAVREALTAEATATPPDTEDEPDGEPTPGPPGRPAPEPARRPAPEPAKGHRRAPGPATERFAPVAPNESEEGSAGRDAPPAGLGTIEADADTPSVDDADSEGPDDREALADVIAMQDAEATPDPQELRGQALTALHPPLVRAIKRELQDVQNVALDRLRRAHGEGDADSLLPDAESNGMGAAVTEYLQAAYQAGVHAASLLSDRDLPEPAAERDLVPEFRTDARARVGSPLAATLRMGRSAGDDPPALSDRVGAVFSELKGTVAEELAESHLIRAYEFGLLDAWTAGGVTHRRWVLGREPRCPEARCRHNDRTGVVPIGETYPSGHEVPPIHIGCNCTTLPASEPPA